MQSLIFFPNTPGDRDSSPEARICSLAMHLYGATIAAGEMSASGANSEAVIRHFAGTLMFHVMQLYLDHEDGFSEIYDFAEKCGLKGEILVGAGEGTVQ